MARQVGYVLQDKALPKVKRNLSSESSFSVGKTRCIELAREALAPVVEHVVQRKARLSERETAVLRRHSLGVSNKRVVRVLEISPSTGGTYVETIFRKLACTTQTAATLKGLMIGII